VLVDKITGKKMSRLDYYMKNVSTGPGMNFPKEEKKEREVVSDTEDEMPDETDKFIISNNAFMLGLNSTSNKLELLEDLTGTLKKAKDKIAEKWLMSFQDAQKAFGRSGK
jgi:hypothetical protein